MLTTTFLCFIIISLSNVNDCKAIKRRNNMKKAVITILAVVMLVSVLAVTLTACNTTVSADSIQSGLAKAGYKVDRFSPVEAEAYVQNLETSKMEGLQAVIHGYKENDSKDEILILVFDKTNHATVSDEKMFMMHDWGKEHAPETESSVYGTHNNCVWAGSQAARNAAGLNI